MRRRGICISFFGVYLIERFNFTRGNIGDYFAVVGICVAFTQAVITRRIAKKFKENTVLKYSMFFNSLIILCYLIPNQGWQMFAIVPFLAVSNGLSQANMIALISKSAPHNVQGEVLGINSGIQALAQTIPSLIAGFIAAQLNPASTVAIGSALIASAAILYNLKVNTEHNKQTANV